MRMPLKSQRKSNLNLLICLNVFDLQHCLNFACLYIYHYCFLRILIPVSLVYKKLPVFPGGQRACRKERSLPNEMPSTNSASYSVVFHDKALTDNPCLTYSANALPVSMDYWVCTSSASIFCTAGRQS